MPMMLTCKPPIRLEMVSWKPRDKAIPPIPRAVIAALTSTPKNDDSTTLTPIAQMTTREMLMKMLAEGSGVWSLLRMRRNTRANRWLITAVAAKINTMVITLLSHPTWMNSFTKPYRSMADSSAFIAIPPRKQPDGKDSRFGAGMVGPEQNTARQDPCRSRLADHR